jgi:putative acetyltransferase
MKSDDNNMDVRIILADPKENREELILTERAFYNVYMEGCDEHILLRDLKKAKEYIPALSFVAKDGDRLIGAIYASKAFIEKGGKKIGILTFGPLGVDPDYQRKGVGEKLVKTLIDKAKKDNYLAIVITGVPTYYPRLGFKSCYELNLKMDDGAQFPALMGYELEKGFFTKEESRFSLASVFSIKHSRKELDTFDLCFPPLKKEKRPGQWKKID